MIGFTTGKEGSLVVPTTKLLPFVSTAIPPVDVLPKSPSVGPRNVEYVKLDKAGSSLETNPMEYGPAI